MDHKDIKSEDEIARLEHKAYKTTPEGGKAAYDLAAYYLRLWEHRIAENAEERARKWFRSLKMHPQFHLRPEWQRLCQKFEEYSED